MSLLERLKNQEQPQQPNKAVHQEGSVSKDEAQPQSSDKTKQEMKPKQVVKARPVLDEKDRAFKQTLHKEILKEIKGDQPKEEIVPVVEELAVELIKEKDDYRTVDRKRVVEELVNDLTGYGSINPLLEDEDVSEVMVNGPDQIYCERKGRLELTDLSFRDDEHVLHVIEKIVAPLGRRIDESSPMVDARLPDGSRVNAIIPPLALNGPTLTIRKFAADPFTINDLVSFGTLTHEMATFIDACVKARLNVLSVAEPALVKRLH